MTLESQRLLPFVTWFGATLALVLLVGVIVGGAAGQTKVRGPASPDQTGSPVFGTLWIDKRTYTRAELLRLAASNNPYERQFAIVQLGEIAETSGVARKSVVEALADKSADVRLLATTIISRPGLVSTSTLIEALRDKRRTSTYRYFSTIRNFEVSRELAVGDLAFALLLNRSVDTGKLIEAYSRLLNQAGRVELKGDALSRLGKVREEGDRWFKNREVVDRSMVQKLLLLISESSPSDPAALLPLLRSKYMVAQEAALLSLGRADKLPTAVGPALGSLIAGGNERLVHLAVKALARVPDAHGRAAFVYALQSGNEQVRMRAVSVLDPNDVGFYQHLRRALEDPSEDVRAVALVRTLLPDREITHIGQLHEPADCTGKAPGQGAVYDALPSDIFERILKERKRADTYRWRVRDGVLRLACSQLSMASAVVEELLPDLGGDPKTRAFAVSILARLASAGHRVRVAEWLPSPPRSDGQLTEHSEVELLAHGEFDASAAGPLLDRYQAFLRENKWRASEYLAALARNKSVAFPVRERLIAQIGSGSIKSPEEAKLVMIGTSPPSGVPDVVQRALAIGTPDLRNALANMLVEAGFRSPDLLVALDGGIRTPPDLSDALDGSRPDSYGAHRAVRNMLKFGHSGAQKVATIVGDQQLAAPARKNVLRDLADEEAWQFKEQLVPVLIGAATSGEASIRSEAIRTLGAWNALPDALQPLLRNCAKDPDPSIRAAAIHAWWKARVPIGEEILSLLKDPSEEVRAGAVRLIPQLKEDDPRRVELLRAALASRTQAGEAAVSQWEAQPGGGSRLKKPSAEHVAALETAAALGSAGWSLINGYLAGEGAIEVSEIDKLQPHAEALIPGLLARLDQHIAGSVSKRERDLAVRLAIIRVLGKFAGDISVRNRLIAIATTGSQTEREAATRSLMEGGLDAWQQGGVLIPVLMEAAVRTKARQWVDRALEVLYPYWGLRPTSGPPDTLPRFPWPPPSGFRSIVVPQSLLGPGVNTLGKVHDQLVAALSKASAGFEWGLFGNVSKGFALVTRMERIQPDGSPYPGQSRWISEGTPLVSLSDFLGNLFFEKPGHFRVISFVVTDDVNFKADATSTLPTIGTGGRVMPKEMRDATFGAGQELLALVYTFERKSGAQMSRWESGAPSAQQHLAAAGVWSRLASR